MFNKVISFITPPALGWLYRQFQQRVLYRDKLFDGDDHLFKKILMETQVYGEYGCGASTRWVLRHTNSDILAVDTSIQWIESVTRRLIPADQGRLKIHHADLGPLLSYGHPASYQHRNRFCDYTDWIWAQAQKPDTVLIDGRFRVCCFLTSLKLADPGTKLIFDDYTERGYYHVVEDFIDRNGAYGRQALFIVPDKKDMDLEKLDIEIANFRYVMD